MTTSTATTTTAIDLTKAPKTVSKTAKTAKSTAAPRVTKNSVIELLETLHTARVAEQVSFTERAANEQSADEKAELLKSAKRAHTHAKYLKRMIATPSLLDAVATTVSSLRLSEQQIKDVESDAYSLRKFAELMIALVQKRKVDDEHSFTEALTRLVLTDFASTDAVSLGKKMTNLVGGAYGARQAQMSLKMLSRIGALIETRIGRNLFFSANADSAVLKRITALYE